MREITSHKVNGLNEALTITVLDEPGHGNACHHYRIEYAVNGPACNAQEIKFQNGPISEAGVNGISNEALLAIVRDRLAGFQSGTFACIENATALASIKGAMSQLQNRTRERLSRGVEGTNQV